MKATKPCLSVIMALSYALITPAALSASDEKEALDALREDIEIMREAHNHQIDLLKKYEEKIQALEGKIETLEQKQNDTNQKVQTTQEQVETTKQQVKQTREEIDSRENRHNPQFGVVLQGRYNHYSEDDEITPAGFTLNPDASRGDEDFTPHGTELIFSGNINDHFAANASVSLEDNNGTTDVSVQEAYITSDILHENTEVKVGRFFPKIGVLNEQHTHADDFIDRPLTNRVFLNNSYRDDGIQASAQVPWIVTTEVGGGAYKGEGFPSGFADKDAEIGAWTVYGRISDNKGNTRWSVGASTLQTDLSNSNASSNAAFFESDDSLYVVDAKLAFAPTGDQTKQDVTIEGEYFYRRESGGFKSPGDSDIPLTNFNEEQHGFYIQGLYKFHPELRVGARFSQLYSGDVLEILPNGSTAQQKHDPWVASAMMDWKSSKEATVRAQYNHEEFDDNQKDNQVMLQYIMSIGTDNEHELNLKTNE